MAKAELGEKRRCLTCSTPFFDLNRTPIVCPKCSAIFQVVEIVRSSSNYSRGRSPAFKKAVLADPVSADAVLLIENEIDVESAIPPTELDDETREAEVTA
jgi:uncharacterized protein (TIGR02300 family)